MFGWFSDWMGKTGWQTCWSVFVRNLFVANFSLFVFYLLMFTSTNGHPTYKNNNQNRIRHIDSQFADFPLFQLIACMTNRFMFFFLFLWCTSAVKRPTNKRYPMNLKNLTEANDDGTMKKCWIEFKSKINKRRNFHNTYHHFVASLFCV